LQRLHVRAVHWWRLDLECAFENHGCLLSDHAEAAPVDAVRGSVVVSS
jgi:hypothetical protein